MESHSDLFRFGDFRAPRHGFAPSLPQTEKKRAHFSQKQFKRKAKLCKARIKKQRMERGRSAARGPVRCRGRCKLEKPRSAYSADQLALDAPRCLGCEDAVRCRGRCGEVKDPSAFSPHQLRSRRGKKHCMECVKQQEAAVWAAACPDGVH